MTIPPSPELSEIVTAALTSGVETSLQEIADRMGLSQQQALAAAAGAVDYVAAFGLELVPEVGVGEFATTRVLRRARTSSGELEEVQRFLVAGEGPAVEFKSSLMCSMYHWRTDGSLKELPKLPGEVLKTLCAFMNSKGGDLLIGVNDQGEVCGGINRDLELKNWTLDDWQLHFSDLVLGRFHESSLVMPYLEMHVLEIGTEPVVWIHVMSKSKRSFVQREKGKPFEFFVRNGSRTDSLDMPAFYEHLLATSRL